MMIQHLMQKATLWNGIKLLFAFRTSQS